MTKLTISAVAAALIPLLHGGTALSQTQRQLDAHEHGHSFLNIAISGNDVLAELESPAANVVGFEHAPENDADHAAIDAAVKQLSQGEQVLTFSPGAECSLVSAEVMSELLEHDDHDGDGHDDHDDHDDDKHDDHDADGHDDHDDDKHDDHDADGHDDHDDDKHDDHDADGHDDHGDEKHDHDDHGDEEAHSEFNVLWEFTCAEPANLTSIDVKLFSLFDGFEEIDVAIAGESAQSSAELTPGSTKIDL